MPSRRLHLPLPPGMPGDMTGITHIYHTADPIPMGACTGAYSGCYAAGFVRRHVYPRNDVALTPALGSRVQVSYRKDDPVRHRHRQGLVG